MKTFFEKLFFLFGFTVGAVYFALCSAAGGRLADAVRQTHRRRGGLGSRVQSMPDSGALPLLAPMSEIAGKLSIQEGAKYLSAGWYEVLKPFIDDRSLTSPDFDFADFDADLDLVDALSAVAGKLNHLLEYDARLNSGLNPCGANLNPISRCETRSWRRNVLTRRSTASLMGA